MHCLEEETMMECSGMAVVTPIWVQEVIDSYQGNDVAR